MKQQHPFSLVIFIVFFFIILFPFPTFSKEKHSSKQPIFHVFSDFESGAVKNLHLRKDGAFGFAIPEEPGGDEYLWFHFKIQFNEKLTPEFVIENAADAHQSGRRWRITRPVFSTDGKNWIRAEYGKYPPWSKRLHDLWKPVFRFKSPVTSETLWVAYFYPYSISMLQSFLSEVADHPYTAIKKMGNSEEGRDILLIEIGKNAESAKVPKKTIWVICREHPGETPASFVCEGLIKAILQTSAGTRLLEDFTFKIVPMLNVDGVAHGYYYHNSRGINLALDWEKFYSKEARLVRDLFADDMKQSSPQLMLNLHSSNDPQKGHFFLEIPENKLDGNDAEFQRMLLETMGGGHPQLQGHAPVRLWNIPGITGNALYSEYGTYCLYVESNYSRGADGSIVTPESLRGVGASLIESLAKVLGEK